MKDGTHLGAYSSTSHSMAMAQAKHVPEKGTHPSHPLHELKLVGAPWYTCDGCKQDGLGKAYHCHLCNFILHPDCMFFNQTAPVDFFPSCSFNFFFQPPPVGFGKEIGRDCDACGMTIHGFVYHCDHCKHVVRGGRDLHPLCLKHDMHIKIADEWFLLTQKVPSKSRCLLCNKKEKKVKGASYFSVNLNLHIHMFCLMHHRLDVRESLASCKDGDNEKALELLRNKLAEHQPKKSGGIDKKFLKVLTALPKTILALVVAVFTGNPLHLISTVSDIAALLQNFS